MNRINSITACSFQGTNYTVYGKQNKHVKYLYNNVKDLVSEHKIPATFCLGEEDKIILSPAAKNAENMLTKTLDKLGIKFSKEVEK